MSDPYALRPCFVCETAKITSWQVVCDDCKAWLRSQGPVPFRAIRQLRHAFASLREAVAPGSGAECCRYIGPGSAAWLRSLVRVESDAGPYWGNQGIDPNYLPARPITRTRTPTDSPFTGATHVDPVLIIGWRMRQQEIDYLRAENAQLRAMLGNTGVPAGA